MKNYNEIFGLCVELSQSTEHDIICTYFGNTDSIEVAIYFGGFKPPDAKPKLLKSLWNPEGEILGFLKNLYQEEITSV